MPRDVTITVRLSDGSANVALKAALSDEDVSTLETYIGYVDDLDALRLVRAGFPFGFRVQVNDGKTIFSARHPDEEQVMAVLHRLRPLVLTNEDASFDRVSGILARAFMQPAFHALLKQIRTTYDCAEAALPRFVSNDVVINSRETLFQWLNAHEYHRDKGKQAALDKALGHAPDIFVRHALLMAIDGLILGVRGLAGLVETVLGRRATFSGAVPSRAATPTP